MIRKKSKGSECMLKYLVMAIFSLSLTQLPIPIKPKIEVIEEYHHDVTGDGEAEKILLYGVPYDETGGYLREIWAEVHLKDGILRINYEGGGYEPELQFEDLTHDGIDDIFYKSATGGSGGLYTQSLNTIIDSKLELIPLPTGDLSGYFIEDFKAIVFLPRQKTPLILDLEKNKEDYIRMGIFEEDGTLIKTTGLMIDPIAFFDIVEVESGYGLKGYQSVSGAFHADQIGTSETIWNYQKGKWRLVSVEWMTPYPQL